MAKLTNGRVGYIHIPDMGAPGIYEFIKWFYPQIRKEGLVVDVRSNGGGNVSQWIIERLSRKLLGTRFGRRATSREHLPGRGLRRPRGLPPQRDLGLGRRHLPLHVPPGRASARSSASARWGGVVGISGRGPLIDGGRVFVPRVRHERRGRQAG